MARRGFWQTGPGAAILRQVQAGALTPEAAAAQASRPAGRRVTPKHVRDALWRAQHADAYHQSRRLPGGPAARREASGLPPDLLRAIDAASAILDATIRVRITELESENQRLQRQLAEETASYDAATSRATAAEAQLAEVEARLTRLITGRAGVQHGD